MAELVVFDTNVFVSYFWTSNETSAVKIVVRKITQNKVIPVFSDEIMREYIDVLTCTKFGFAQHKICSFLKLIRCNGLCVNPAPTSVPFTDTSDRPFYDAAVAACAWLVTGNTRHYPDEPFIASPREWLERMGL